MRKYEIITHGNQIIAITKYFGRSIKGIATCSENDAFDVVTGTNIAKLKCEKKILMKQKRECEKQARKSVDAAHESFKSAITWMNKAEDKDVKIQDIDEELSKF